MSDEGQAGHEAIGDGWRTVTIFVVLLVAVVIATVLVGDHGPSEEWCAQQHQNITRDQQLTESGQQRRLSDWTEICR